MIILHCANFCQTVRTHAFLWHKITEAILPQVLEKLPLFIQLWQMILRMIRRSITNS
jgi:hypothetical protein